MEQKTKAVYRFGVFELAPSERQLRRNGEPVSVPPKVFDLLVVLAEHPGELLEKDVLLKAVWPDTFVEEANLSVHISTLRRALGDTPDACQIIQTVPKKGYRFVAAVEEVRHTPAEIEPESPSPAPGRRRAIPALILTTIGTAVVIALAIGIFTTHAGEPGIHSVAVLPFTALNGDHDEEYLGLGMADALITRLSGVQELTVRPTSSVLKYAHFTGTATSIGHALSVDGVVEGRIQKTARSVRVTVQLLRADDGASIWADHFEDSFTNIFAVQDSITEKVAAALRMKLATGARGRDAANRGTDDMLAYQYFLQGRYLSTRRLNETTQQAIEYFNQAIGSDPDYALAYAALANEYITRASFNWPQQLTESAKTAALKALALDPALPDAHVSLGQILMRAEWDWSGAQKAFSRAIALQPNNAAAHAAKSLLLTALSRHEDAIREMETAWRLDPGNASLRSDLAWTYNHARRFDRALEHAQAAVRMDPQSFTSRRELNKAYLELQQYDKALEEIQAMANISGGENRRTAAESAQVCALAGRPHEARNWLARLASDKWRDPHPLYLIAVAQANLGERDAAFRGLNAALDARTAAAIWMASDPELDSIRSDPRYELLLKRLRLTGEASRN